MLGIASGPAPASAEFLSSAGAESSAMDRPASPASGSTTAGRMPPVNAAAASSPQVVPMTGIMRPARGRALCLPM
jgi:hypothetical protein